MSIGFKGRNVLKVMGIGALLVSSFANFQFTFAQSHDADLVPVERRTGSPYQSCVGDVETVDLYLNEDNDSDGIADLYFYPNHNYRKVRTSGPPQTYDAALMGRYEPTNPDTSRFEYNIPEANMIYQVDESDVIGPLAYGSFYRASYAFPLSTWVRAFDTSPTKVVLERPSTNLLADAHTTFRYVVKNKHAEGFSVGTSDYRYNIVDGQEDHGPMEESDYTLLSPNTTRNWSDIQTSIGCRDYEMHWCGDGEINNGDYAFGIEATEQCDDGNTNNDDACSNTCQINEPNDPPICELTFDGNPATNISINNGDTVDIQCDGEHANRGRYTRNATNYPLSTMAFGVLPVGGDITFTKDQDYVVQCQVKNEDNTMSDVCEATISVTSNPSSCTVNVQENEVYVYEDGSFDPNPIHVVYAVDGAQGTTIETNIPGAQNNTNDTVNIVANVQNNYYINILDADGVQVAQCADTINLDSCGDNQLQPEYEQCEINTNSMPAPGVVNNLEALLPDYIDVFNKQIGGVYAAERSFVDRVSTIFNRKKSVRSEASSFDARSVVDDRSEIRADVGNDVKQPIPSDLDGCSNTCQLETPTCNVVMGPGEINAGERAYFSGQTQEWSTFLTLDFDEGGPTYDFATSFPGGLPVAYFHFDSGVYYDGYDNPMIGYNYVATVENARGMAGSRQLINPNVMRPQNICGGDTTVDDTLIDVEKSLLQEGVVFMSGDMVGFQIIVTNDSSGWVYGLSVTDYFSPLLEWDGNIEIIGLGNNTVVTTGVIVGDPDLEWITVSNIDLAPMSTGAIYLSGVMYSHLCNWPNTGVMTGDAMDEPIWFGASFPCNPVASVEKFQSTGTDLSSFTQDLLQVEIGDSLNYRVEFANNGGSPTSGGVTISDYLPAGITYVGSEIFVYTGGSAVVPNPLYTDQGTLGNQDYIVYSGFDLDSEQSGYMMIYGEVSSDLNYFVYENTAELLFTNPYMSSVSNEVVAVRDQDILFQKDIINASGTTLTSGGTIVPYFFSGDEIRFEISLMNLGEAISGVVVDDVWPDVDQNCIAYSGWESADLGRSWNTGTWRWTYAPTLFELDQTAFTLIGEVVGGQDCVGSYVNTGLLRYYQNGTLYTGEDEAVFEIRDNNMLLEKTVDSTDVAPGSEITFFLYFENNGSNTISNFVLRDLRPATVALQPSLTHPKPYTYIGPGNPSFTPPQPVDGGRELQWSRGGQEFLPGETGMVILTGIVLDAVEAIELYEETH